MPGRKPGPRRQAVRVLRIAGYLMTQRAGVPFDRLAKIFGISERQVYRDISAIRESGFPVRVVNKMVLIEVSGEKFLARWEATARARGVWR